jgi:hypothetical protein
MIFKYVRPSHYFLILSAIFWVSTQETLLADDDIEPSRIDSSPHQVKTSFRPDRQNKEILEILKSSGTPYAVYRADPTKTKNNDGKKFPDTVFVYVTSDDLKKRLYKNGRCDDWDGYLAGLGGAFTALVSLGVATIAGVTGNLPLAMITLGGAYEGYAVTERVVTPDTSVDLCWKLFPAKDEGFFDKLVALFDYSDEFNLIETSSHLKIQKKEL